MSKSCKYCDIGDEPTMRRWHGKETYYHTTDVAQGLREKCTNPDYAPTKQTEQRKHFMARLIFGARYAAGNLGAVQFYDSLTDYEKKFVSDAIDELAGMPE